MYVQFGTNIQHKHTYTLHIKLLLIKSTTMKMATAQNFHLYPVSLTWMQSVSK
jgi:hypothetical protein